MNDTDSNNTARAPRRKAPPGFWGRLTLPIYALAPMSDVTDAAYRRLIARLGKPDVLFTEFVSCDGLCSAGYENLRVMLEYDESERPIVAQVFGANPETFFKAARIVRELGFDGLDINMGCPDRNVCKQGAGAALLRNPALAREIVLAAKEGVGTLPVSVKTRIGYNEIEMEDWVGHLLETKPAAITLHFRTRKEMSRVAAHWDTAPAAVALARNTDTLILGNGDVWSLEQADQLRQETGVDGVMLGRAVFSNPWLFDRSRRREDIGLAERMDIMLQHARLYEELFSGRKRFIVMRKHLRGYLAGLPGAKEFRMLLDTLDCAADVDIALDSVRQVHNRSTRPPESA